MSYKKLTTVHDKSIFPCKEKKVFFYPYIQTDIKIRFLKTIQFSIVTKRIVPLNG
jgi:hypothetical protein